MKLLVQTRISLASQEKAEKGSATPQFHGNAAVPRKLKISEHCQSNRPSNALRRHGSVFNPSCSLKEPVAWRAPGLGGAGRQTGRWQRSRNSRLPLLSASTCNPILNRFKPAETSEVPLRRTCPSLPISLPMTQFCGDT